MIERRRRNHIGPLVTSDGVLKEVKEVKKEVKNHFGVKFKENYFVRPCLEGVPFKALTFEDIIFLESSFSESEIRKAVWSY